MATPLQARSVRILYETRCIGNLCLTALILNIFLYIVIILAYNQLGIFQGFCYDFEDFNSFDLFWVCFQQSGVTAAYAPGKGPSTGMGGVEVKQEKEVCEQPLDHEVGRYRI